MRVRTGGGDGAQACAAIVAEILWAAASDGHRNRGVGTVLIGRVLAELGDDGARLVEVETLDPAAGYAPYVDTYRFWTRRGFVHVDPIDPLPGWEPGNPGATLVAARAPTVPGPPVT